MAYKSGCGCENGGLGAYGRVRYVAPGSPPPSRALGYMPSPGQLPYGSLSLRGAPRQLGYLPWGTIIGAGVDLTRSLIDGGSSVCPNQDGPELVAAKLDGATPAQQTELVAALRGTAPTWFPAGSTFQQLYGLADQLAFAVAGGSDCKVGTTAGTRLVAAYSALVPRAAAPDPTVYYPTSGTYQPPVYDPGPLLATSSPTAAPDAGTGLLDTLKQAVTDAARAAAEAATRSVSTSATQIPAVSDQLRIYEQERRASFVTSSLPWIVGGGLVIGALLMSGKRR